MRVSDHGDESRDDPGGQSQAVRHRQQVGQDGPVVPETVAVATGAVFPGAKVFSTNLDPEEEIPFNAASKQNKKDKKEPDKPEI